MRTKQLKKRRKNNTKQKIFGQHSDFTLDPHSLVQIHNEYKQQKICSWLKIVSIPHWTLDLDSLVRSYNKHKLAPPKKSQPASKLMSEKLRKKSQLIKRLYSILQYWELGQDMIFVQDRTQTLAATCCILKDLISSLENTVFLLWPSHNIGAVVGTCGSMG